MDYNKLEKVLSKLVRDANEFIRKGWVGNYSIKQKIFATQCR